MKKNNSWIILIYALLLVVLTSVLVYIIVNKQSMMMSNLYQSYYDTKISKNIYNKADISWKDYLIDNTWSYSQIKWYIKTDSDFNNIFWNSSRVSNFISGSTFSYFPKLWSIWTWVIFLDINNSSKLKVVEFDKASFDEYSILKPLSSKEILFSSWFIWYLTDTSFTLSWALAKKFDFKNKNIALFLNYTQSWSIHPELDYLTYNLKIYNESLSSLTYINPFKIDLWKFVYFWADIIPDSWKYIMKEMTLIK